jgi:hypothetical protein
VIRGTSAPSFLFFLLLWCRGRPQRKALRAAIQASIRLFHGHEEQILIYGHITLPARAHQRSQELGIRRMGNVIDIHAIKISLKQVVALERKIRVRKSKLRDDQMQGLRHLCDIRRVELPQHLQHLWIIGVSGPELKCGRLLEKHKVLDAHRCFTRVIKARLQLCARIVYI